MLYTASRLEKCFAALANQNRAGLGIFITAGDPDAETSLAIMKALPGAGADMIEFGMPFSDPMADGPSVQASSQRSLKAGGSLARRWLSFALSERMTGARRSSLWGITTRSICMEWKSF